MIEQEDLDGSWVIDSQARTQNEKCVLFHAPEATAKERRGLEHQWNSAVKLRFKVPTDIHLIGSHFV